MKIPTYYKGNVKNIVEDDEELNGFTTMFLCDNMGNDLFYIYYYGELYEQDDEKSIIPTDFSAVKIIAKSIITNNDILIFDGTKHGYDNMFCNLYTKEQIDNRPVKKLDTIPYKIKISIEYSINYEEEKDQYTFEDNKVVLVDGTKIPWEDVITNGITWIIISTISETGETTNIVEEELA